jgi:hypothetical protein
MKEDLNPNGAVLRRGAAMDIQLSKISEARIFERFAARKTGFRVSEAQFPSLIVHHEKEAA